VAFVSPLVGIGLSRLFSFDINAGSVAGSALGLAYVVTCLLLSSQPRVIVSDGGRTRKVTFVIQFALTVISGVVGWVLGRVGDALIPPPSP